MSKANSIDATGPIGSSGDERPWTVLEAAQFLGVSPQTVYLWYGWSGSKFPICV